MCIHAVNMEYLGDNIYLYKGLWNGDERFKIKKMSPKSNGQFELTDKGISLTK